MTATLASAIRAGMRRTRPLALSPLLGAALWALSQACSDAPCASYWEKVCDTCKRAAGPDAGCDNARRWAAAALKDASSCAEQTKLLGEVLGEPGGAEVVCALPREGLPPKSLRGAFVCDGRAVTLGLDKVAVGDKSFPVSQFSAAQLNVQMSQGHGQMCILREQEGALFIRCPESLGGLPTTVRCERP